VVLSIPSGCPPVNFIVTLKGGNSEPLPQEEDDDEDQDQHAAPIPKKGRKVSRGSRPWDQTSSESQEEDSEQEEPRPVHREDSLELLAKQGFSLYKDRNRELLRGLPEPYPSDHDILRWGRDTRKYMRRRGFELSKEALQYWVKYFFDPSQEPERWKYVRDRIAHLF
jgi:hypothetical protein